MLILSFYVVCRRIVSVAQDIWVITDKIDADDFLLRMDKNDDAAKVAQRFAGCKLLKEVAAYDLRVAQAIKDDLFPLDQVVSVSGESSPDRRRTASHPELPNQPLLTPGQSGKDGLYKNRFGRKGKELHSEIFVKKGIMNEIGKYYTQFLPTPCLTAQNFIIVDEICDSVMDVDGLFVKTLADKGVACEKIVVPSDVADDSGETSTEPFKNNQVFTKCVNQILASGVSKHSCIISLGGGVVNNMCGVLAGMIYRGIHLVRTAVGDKYVMEEMVKRGYDRDYAVNVCITAALVALLVPPSHNLILYSAAAGGGLSIADLFAAGIVPALLMTLALMVTGYVVARRRGYGVEPFPGRRAVFLRAVALAAGRAGANTVLHGGALGAHVADLFAGSLDAGWWPLGVSAGFFCGAVVHHARWLTGAGAGDGRAVGGAALGLAGVGGLG